MTGTEGGIANLDNAGVRMEFNVAEFIAFGYRKNPVYAIENGEVIGGKPGFITDDTNNRDLITFGNVDMLSVFFNISGNSSDALVGGIGFHNNNHGITSFLPV